MRTGVFVTGTDTGIGKTLVAACLVHAWHADYWKPVQTGIATEPGDTDTVATLAGLTPSRIHPPRFTLKAPLSPEAAAAREGVSIHLADFALPPGHTPIVVEGAGGVLVPLGSGTSMADLIAHLGLATILVARGSLGTINHTLLSIEALRARNLPIAGIIVCGPEHDGNAETIARLGAVPLLGLVPRLDPVSPAAVAHAAGALSLPSAPPAAYDGLHPAGAGA